MNTNNIRVKKYIYRYSIKLLEILSLPSDFQNSNLKLTLLILFSVFIAFLNRFLGLEIIYSTFLTLNVNISYDLLKWILIFFTFINNFYLLFFILTKIYYLFYPNTSNNNLGIITVAIPYFKKRFVSEVNKSILYTDIVLYYTINTFFLFLLTLIYIKNFTFLFLINDTIAKFSVIYSIIGGSILSLLYIDYHSSSNIEFDKKGFNLLQIIYWSVWIAIWICPVLYVIFRIFDVTLIKVIIC